MSFLKRFAVNVAVEVALHVVRGYLNKAIEKFTPDDMYDAIRENRDLWGVLPEDMLKQTREFKNTYKGLFEKHINDIDIELILKWIKEDHFDLFSIIIQPTPPDAVPKGIIWLNNQIIKIKKEILEI